MIRPLSIAAPLGVLASPALAHAGAHLHPHGIDLWIVGAIAATLALAAFAIWRGMR